MGLIAKIDRTTYHAHKTRKGRHCLLVKHYTTWGEVVARYLFPHSDEMFDFLDRRTKKRVYTVDNIVKAGRVGQILPTAEIEFVRDGRFHRVIDEKVGSWDPAFFSFMKNVREIFGEVEVLEVKG